MDRVRSSFLEALEEPIRQEPSGVVLINGKAALVSHDDVPTCLSEVPL